MHGNAGRIGHYTFQEKLGWAMSRAPLGLYTRNFSFRSYLGLWLSDTALNLLMYGGKLRVFRELRGLPDA